MCTYTLNVDSEFSQLTNLSNSVSEKEKERVQLSQFTKDALCGLSGIIIIISIITLAVDIFHSMGPYMLPLRVLSLSMATSQALAIIISK